MINSANKPSAQSLKFANFSKKLRIAFHDIFRNFYDYKEDVNFYYRDYERI